MEPKPLYIILGAPKSGRREVVFDLIDGGLPENHNTAVYLSNEETASPHDEQIPSLENVSLLRWKLLELNINAAPPPEAADTVFFITEGTADPIDQIEGLKAWSSANNLYVARVLTVVNCALAEAHEGLLPWYEACIHFSDYVLLNRRESVSNKWIREFQQHFESNYYPCLFAYVKKGKLDNPPLVLDPEPRRLSHTFDEMDAIDTLEIDEDNLPDEVFDLTAPVDPYLVRLPSGQREKQIPQITDFLE